MSEMSIICHYTYIALFNLSESDTKLTVFFCPNVVWKIVLLLILSFNGTKFNCQFIYLGSCILLVWLTQYSLNLQYLIFQLTNVKISQTNKNNDNCFPSSKYFILLILKFKHLFPWILRQVYKYYNGDICLWSDE